MLTAAVAAEGLPPAEYTKADLLDVCWKFPGTLAHTQAMEVLNLGMSKGVFCAVTIKSDGDAVLYFDNEEG